MRRGPTGQFNTTPTGGETVRAFVPNPLPPEPALDLGVLQESMEKALLALGQLDSLSTLLPNVHQFLYTYVRKEAVLSSQIEGTQSTLSDLLIFELDEAPGTPLDDVIEVSNYVAALEHGISRLKGGFPLSNRLVREVHDKLLSHGRGSGKMPGEFRKTQNWIGGTRPGRARFVPPPPHAVEDCMTDLERFYHKEDEGLPALLRAGLAHVQFETIHPFLDGNGRVGRLMITLALYDAGTIHQPLLYLSLYFKQHRDRYYALLDEVRENGDWEAWLEFFFDGVAQTAQEAVSTAQRLLNMFQQDQAKIQQEGRRAGSALRVHQVLQKRPIASLREMARGTGLSFAAAAAGVKLLEQLGIVRELTGKKRNRFFGHQQYLDVLAEESEVP
ncbi:MAG: Fic family protein [Gammaproteobacteria bacterium]|nr:Fic family protein [Gammaproteobacteria bacterium]